MHEITAEAIEAIGLDDPNSDWKLAPETHASRLPSSAGALKRILQTSDVQTIMDQFRAADIKAMAAQMRYRRVARIRLYAAAAATLIGAAFLLPLEAWINPTDLSIPGALQYGCLAFSFVASLYLARSKSFDTWMKARAVAEAARIGLFNQIMKTVDPSPQPGHVPLLPLKLEYFRRYQLDVQGRYYRRRSEEHSRAAGHTHRWQLVSIALSGIAGVVAVTAGLKMAIDFGAPVPNWAKAVNDVIQQHLPGWIHHAILAIGIIASTLFGVSISRSLMDLDERNASRYLTTAANLDYVTELGLEDARGHAATGAEAPVQSFVAQVQAILSAEHQEWILLKETMPRVDSSDIHLR